MKFAIYDQSGRITQTCTAPSGRDVESAVPPGHAFCEVGDDVSDGSHVIRDGVAIRLPSRPGRNHVFDYSLHTWVDPRTDADLAREARALRDARIAASDWVMLPDVAVSDEAKALWIDYRRALRDISTQAGFPKSIDWPIRPQ